jgi:uncharacterized iron-regulated membrane protein
MQMRPVFVLLHRWFGLAVAVFLFVSGLTGAVISWDHELDAWLNPQLFHARSAMDAGEAKADRRHVWSGLELANKIETNDPRVRVTYVLNEEEPGHTIQMSVEGKIDPATAKPYALGFNQIAVDPVTAEIQGKRQWGEISLSRENLLPFLYKLHYTMHLPEVSGVELGIWLMGLIAVVWVLDCFIALWISFPNWRSWRKSFAFRWAQGGHKLNFDLHRSSAVWLWLFMLLLAVTSVSMNLNTQIVRPVVAWFSPLSEDVFASRVPRALEQPIIPAISRENIVSLARQEAQQRGWSLPAGGIFYSSAFGVYGVGFLKPVMITAMSVLAMPGCILMAKTAALWVEKFRYWQCRRYFSASAVPAAFRTHTRLNRTHTDFIDGAGGGDAERDRRHHLGQKATGKNGSENGGRN